jgi:hypothetical protein
MAKLVILITSQIDAGYEVGEAWQEHGAPGVTLINSYGLHQVQEASKKSEVLPGVLSMLELVRNQHENNLILLSVVDDVVLAEELIDTANQVLGDLYKPNNGLMFVLDVEQVFGLRHPVPK